MPAQVLDARQIFLEAIENHAPDQWPEFVDAACGGDAALRQRVEALMKAHGQYNQMLDGEGLVATLDRPVSERPGTQIGPYKLLQQIGEGGFGVVFMAEQLEPVRRRVAVKVIKPGMDTRQVIARFEAERQALAVMDHPNIARVLDAGATESGRPYFVMELVRGVPITAYCDESNLPVRERLELFASVCKAIQHAHTKGIIHRDIKPTNVLVTRLDGQPVVKVIDFGISKAMGQQLTDKTLFTAFAQMIGTPLYMSPEQAELSSNDIDTRSDIYSLGVLLYELLTGSTPVSKEQLKQAAFDEIRRIIREDEPQKPSTRISSAEAAPSIAAQRHTEPAKLARLVRGELDWIVMKSLEKDRNRRYETANGFAADVQRYLHDEPVLACPPSAAYRFSKFARRNKAIFTMVGVVTVALLLGIVGTTWQAIHASWQRDRAVAAENLAQTRLDSETRARREADEQRLRAENKSDEAARNLREARKAVDDWFTTISQTTLLEAPGLKPLRQELLEAALAYYQGLLEQAQDNPELRADLAAAQMRLSVIYISFDRNDDAIAAMLRGLELVEQLNQERPGDTEFPQRLAGCFRCGGGFYQRTRPPADHLKAVNTLQKAAEIWEQFTRDNPATAEFQGDLAGIYVLLSAVFQASDLERSLKYSLQSRAILEKLVRAKPSVAIYQELLVLTYAENATVLTRLKRTQDSEQVGLQSIRYFEDLAREFPTELSARRCLAAIHNQLASRRRVAQPVEAEKMYRQALGILETLVAKSQANAHDRHELRVTYHELAGLLQKDGRIVEAEAFVEKAMAISEKLVLDFPDSPDFRLELAKRYHSQAEQIKESRPLEAEQLYRRALAIHEKLVADFPDQPRYLPELVRCHGQLMALLQTTGTTIDIEKLYRQAIARYEQLLNKSPNLWAYHSELAHNHNRLGILLLNAGRVPEAKIELGKVQEIWRAHSGPELERLKQVAEADPQNGLRWGELAGAYYRAGKWQDSLDIYKTKEHLGYGISGSAFQWLPIAMTHWQLDHQEEARAWYYKALDWIEAAQEKRLRNEQQEASLLLGMPDPTQRSERAWSHVATGAALEKESQLDLAKEAYGIAIGLYESLATDYPSVLSYTKKLADLLTRCGRQQELEQVFRRAIAAREMLPGASPDLRLANANQCNDLAFMLLAAGRLSEAEEFVRKGLQLKLALATEFPEKPDYRFHLAHSYLGLATILVGSGQASAAVEANTAAGKLLQQLAADETGSADFRQWNAHALFQLGEAWLRLDRPADAQEAYEQGLTAYQQLAKADPANRFYQQEQGYSYQLLANVAQRAGRKEEREQYLRAALECYQKMAYEVPDSTSHRQELASVQSRMGELYRELGEWDKAVAEFTKAIELKPDAWEAWAGRASVHFHRQRWDDAVADYSKAIDLTPQVHALWWHRGHSYNALEQWDKAAADFGKAVEGWPDGGEGWYWRAVAFAQSGQLEKAVADLRQSAAKGFNSVERMKNDPKLDPLRAREDFGKLLEELKQKEKPKSK